MAHSSSTSVANILCNGLSIALMLLGFISSIVGMTPIYWFNGPGNNTEFGIPVNITQGLWRVCVTGVLPDQNTATTSCGYLAFSSIPVWLHLTRAFMITSLVPFMIAFCFAVISCAAPLAPPLITTGVLVLAEAILQGIGLVIYLIGVETYVKTLEWAFYVCCGSVVTLFLGSISFFIHAIAVRFRREEYHIIN